MRQVEGGISAANFVSEYLNTYLTIVGREAWHAYCSKYVLRLLGNLTDRLTVLFAAIRLLDKQRKALSKRSRSERNGSPDS